jgi:CRP-like cAMP-binding protein
MQNGQLFGEIGLANQEATVRTATCLAKGPTYVAVIKK